MRVVVFFFSLACLLGCIACGHTNAGTRARSNSNAPVTATTKLEAISNAAAELAPVKSSSSSARVDFPTQIKPILEARCQPCHFSGGKVYGKMPFDRPETIKTLGTKMFTRIKDENERRLISDFLAQ